jgi:hypothetical protein
MNHLEFSSATIEDFMYFYTKEVEWWKRNLECIYQALN